MTSLEFIRLAEPVAGAVAEPLSNKIQSKLNANELEKALNVAIKSSSQLGEELFSQLFSSWEPDSIPGFLGNFFKDVVVEEFQKLFNNQGTPQIDYLVEVFKDLAWKHEKIKNFDEKYLKDWMEKFVNTFLSETNIYLKFQVAKDNYLKKLADRLSEHHFVGMGVAVNKNSAYERLEKIFVMPDVAEEILISKLNQTLELESDLLLDTGEGQVDLIKAQQEKVLLLREKSEKRNPFPAQYLLDSNKSKGQKLVLLGAPGSGKTTLMNYLALKIAQRKSEDLELTQNTINQNTIPIFIRIRELAQEKEINILNYIEEYAAKNLQVTDLPQGCFKHWLEQGEVVILLDGFDEVAQENQQVKVVQHIESFLQEFSRNRVIITSRPAGYEGGYFRLDGFSHYEIQAFDDKKIKFFISQWYDNHCEDKVEASRQTKYLEAAIERQDRIKLLAINPLLLTIIVLINRVDAELPRERYKLYERAVETLLTAWDVDKELNYRLPLEYLKSHDFKPLMQEIAFWIHSKGSRGTLINQNDLIEQLSWCIKKRKKIELYEAKVEAKNFLGYIQERAGLLDVQGRNCYAFVHKTFQEYLAAEDIDYRHQNDDSFEVVLDSIRNHLHDPHWREVLLLLVAKQKSNKAAKAIRLILDSNSRYEKWLYRDLFFAADCLAEDPIDLQLSDDDPSREILERLVELEVSDSREVIYQIREQVFKNLCNLHETEFNDDALGLLKEREDNIDKVRFQEYRAALGEEQEAIEQLLLLLKDTYPGVCRRAAHALGRLGNTSDDVVQQLLPLLKDTDSDVRESAADALGRLGNTSDDVVQQLLLLLKDSNGLVRGSAAQTLGNLANPSDNIVQQLLLLLKDSNGLVRGNTAQVLGNLANPSDNVVQQLLPLLKDSDDFVRGRAADALGNLANASDDVVQQLLPILKDTDYSVRLSGADALGNLANASDNVVQQLLLLLKDSDYSVHRSAVDALGNLANVSDDVVQQLLPLLKDSDDFVRGRAANVLSKLGNVSDDVVQQFLPLLKDSEYYLRGSAAYGLGKLANASDDIVQQLLPLLKDSDDFVRGRATEALGNLGNASDDVVQQLLPLLKDSYYSVRGWTANALGKLANTSDNVVVALEKWLEEEQDSEYKQYGVMALWYLVLIQEI